MTTKLRLSQDQGTRRFQVTLDKEADQHLKTCRLGYVPIADRAVSDAVIIRRALALLADHVTEIGPDQYRHPAEVNALKGAAR